MSLDKSYIDFVKELKDSILLSRYKAASLANREQILLYYNVGCKLSEKIAFEKWGNSILKNIAADLQSGLPGLRGFSERNLYNMKLFYDTYSTFPVSQSSTAESDKVDTLAISQSVTAKFDNSFFGISFTHHILLINKCKDWHERHFYIKEATGQFWSVSLLERQIAARRFHHQGNLPNNFSSTLPAELKSTALQVFQDEYLFDFLSINEDEDERIFEANIVANIRQFIMSMGKGFSFIGNQYRLEVEGEEFFIDLLFFNRNLQCLVAFELKRGKFKPAYAGQLNFYLNILDDKVRLPNENPSIGIILCKEKSNTVVEYAFKSIDKAMGAATFKTVRQVPKELKGILPGASDLAKLLENNSNE
jgi:predicted nuclease of restriction endonuclease-like (RecB) superfamily